MATTYQAMPWKAFPEECLWYLLPMSIVHLVLFAIGCIVLIWISVLRETHRNLFRRIRRLALFLALLLLFGSLANGIWSCSIYGRFYFSSDYIFDFMPFWPINSYMIFGGWGFGRGALYGISLFELQLIWFSFALVTWVATIFSYRILIQKLG